MAENLINDRNTFLFMTPYISPIDNPFQARYGMDLKPPVELTLQRLLDLEEARQTMYEAQALIEIIKNPNEEQGYYANHWANLFEGAFYEPIVEDLVDRLHFLKGVHQKYGDLAPRLFYDQILQNTRQNLGVDAAEDIAFKAKWDFVKKGTLECLGLELLKPDWQDEYSRH